jgi:PleD family two-component response regulator
LLPGESAESLLRRADSALYVAKREGRNRLAMAG